MSMPSWPLCWLWHRRSQQLDLTSLIVVWSSRLCSKLVWILSIITILPCQVWEQSIFIVLLFLGCSPRGCVLGSLLYTAPLSTLISSLSLSLNYYLYADETQLFVSFHPRDFDLSITRFQNALQQIYSWITANLLALNTSKTEFLLIRLSKQLAKIIQNSSLNTTYQARNLGFDEHLIWSDLICLQILLLGLTIFVNFAAFVHTLIPKSHHHCHICHPLQIWLL